MIIAPTVVVENTQVPAAPAKPLASALPAAPPPVSDSTATSTIKGASSVSQPSNVQLNGPAPQLPASVTTVQVTPKPLTPPPPPAPPIAPPAVVVKPSTTWSTGPAGPAPGTVVQDTPYAPAKVVAPPQVQPSATRPAGVAAPSKTVPDAVTPVAGTVLGTDQEIMTGAVPTAGPQTPVQNIGAVRDNKAALADPPLLNNRVPVYVAPVPQLSVSVGNVPAFQPKAAPSPIRYTSTIGDSGTPFPVLDPRLLSLRSAMALDPTAAAPNEGGAIPADAYDVAPSPDAAALPAPAAKPVAAIGAVVVPKAVAGAAAQVPLKPKAETVTGWEKAALAIAGVGLLTYAIWKMTGGA